MGVEFTPFPKIPRLSRPCIITEKIDGTNASIYIAEDGTVKAASRSRWIEPAQDNHGFAGWVYENKDQLVKELGVGHHFGEWWGRGINRGYGATERYFSLFNTTRWEGAPLELCRVVPVLYHGPFSTGEVDSVLRLLAESGSRAMPGYDNPEGVVVFHMASRALFKKTIENDEAPKGIPCPA